jgi:putative addiction module component (TIGR02574 family)
MKRDRDLLERALELPMPERVKLAQELLDSLDAEQSGEPELDPGYRDELIRRALDEPKPGERWPTAAEVVASLRKDLEKRSSRVKRRKAR